jgi:hypothetical protein
MLVGQPAPIGPEQAGQSWPFLMVQNRNDEPNASIYPAIIEAYVGLPFIQRVTMPEITNNDSSALRAVALKVETVNGHEDLCISDGHVDRWRQIEDTEVAARFGCVSIDEKGLRMAQVIEGKGLKSPHIFIEIDMTAFRTRITSVDYLKREIQVQPPIPELMNRNLTCFGVGNRDHRTSFMITGGPAENSDGRAFIRFDRPADRSYARVLKIDPIRKRVYTNIGPATIRPGNDRGLTCTNDNMTKAWKCNILGRRDGGYAYQLLGNLAKEDLPPGSTFRLWEFGVGDEIRIPTHAHVWRRSDGKFILNTNTRARLKLNGRSYDSITMADSEKRKGNLVLPD